VQAGAARRIGGRDPDQVTELLSTVEDSSREAVDELRRLAGCCAPGNARAADGERSLEPLPGLGRLARLVAATRATGLDVSLTVVGDERAVPDSVSVSAYRVVQEAVTNTIKHAHARRCAVGVEYSADAVEVSVVDDGIGTRAPAVVGSDGWEPAPNGGYGVVGMGEWVALHGGRLDIGPRPEGGFGVRARFPVRNAPCTASCSPATSAGRRSSRDRDSPLGAAVPTLRRCLSTPSPAAISARSRPTR
jgi:signal transduction histidine kinase